jgi:H+/gluconate symporter-like permease
MFQIPPQPPQLNPAQISSDLHHFLADMVIAFILAAGVIAAIEYARWLKRRSGGPSETRQG